MADFTHSLALVIGIDAYDHGIPRLTTAVNDATRLAELLRAEHGYETILLTDLAVGQPVTGERLHTFFTKELQALLGEDDRLLVYFAGHGVALDGDDGPRGYLVPQDARPGDSASMLAMTDLHAWLTALPCRHMLAILDCCFAGAFRWSSTRDLGALPDVIHKERYDRYLLSPAWQVLTSAAYDQKALDVLAGDVKRGARAGDRGLHSPFALALFDALAGAGDVVPTQQGDGVITASELFVYLQDVVSREAEERANHEQMPGLWPLNKHRKGEFIFLVPGHPLNLPPAPALTDEANPYRGLKSYDQKHAQLFFGRDDEIEELAALVDQRPFVAVLGASGTGKSSLVKAGVLARLQPNPPTPFPRREGGARDGLRDQLHDSEILSPPVGRGVASSELPSPPGGRGVVSSELSSPPGGRGVASSELPSPSGGGAGGWVFFSYQVLSPMRPTDHPMRALEALLHAELGADPSGLLNPKGLADGDDALAQIVARWAATHPDQRLVLTIDQFEELATLCRDDAERDRFLRLLATAVRQQPDAFRLIITLRTDFEPQFTQQGSPFTEAWGQGRYVVPPMDIEDLRQVIEGPASVRVLYFDPPELVDDLIKEVIQTPGALPLLSFTLSELYVKYVRSGRDDRALSGVDYKALGGVVGSLRNRATEEYDALLDDAHRLTMQRVMLRMVAVEGGGELARRRVALSELEYPTPEENERVKTVIDRLVDARLLVRGTAEVPDGTKGEAYVEPAHDALVLAWDKLLRWRKEAEEYLPLQRRLAQAAGEWSKAQPEAKSGLLWDDDPRLPQVEETLWPTGGRRKGLRGRIRWAKQVLAPKTDVPLDTKWLNGVELRFSQVSISRRASTFRRIIGITAAVMLVLISLTVTASNQATIATRERNNAVKAQANEADARQVAQTREAEAQTAATAEATARLMAEDRRAAAVAAQETAVAERNIADTRRLASESGAALDVNQPRSLLLAVEAQTISDETGQYVRSAQGSLLDALTSPSGLALPGAPAGMEIARYSQTGRWIAGGGADGNLYLWDAENPYDQASILGSHSNEIDWMAFTSDDQWLVTADKDSVRAWPLERPDMDSHILYQRSSPEDSEHPGIEVFAASPDGRRVAIGTIDGRVWAWSVAPFSREWSLSGFGFNPYSVTVLAFSADGRLLFTNNNGGPYALIYNLDHIEDTTVSLSGHQQRVTAGAFSPDGKWLVTADSYGDVFLWSTDAFFDKQTGRFKSEQIRSTPLRIFPGGEAPVGVQNVTFDPNSHWVAASDQNGTIRLWSLQSAFFSSVIASATGQNAEGRQLQSVDLVGHRSSVPVIEFSRDGNSLASGSIDGSVRVWDVAPLVSAKLDISITRDQVKLSDVNVVQADTLQGHVGQTSAVAFSLDGQSLLTADSAGPARLWNLDHLAALPAHIARFGRPGGMMPCGTDRWLFRPLQDDGAVEARTITSESITVTVVSGVQDATCSPDGHWLAGRDNAGRITVWRATPEGPEAFEPLTGHDGKLTDFMFSHNNRWLASTGDDRRVLFWDLEDLKRKPIVLENGGQRVTMVMFSPDDNWLATAGYLQGKKDEALKPGYLLWDISALATGFVTPTIPAGKIESVEALGFSDNSLRIYTRDFSGGGTIRLWDIHDLKNPLTSFEADPAIWRQGDVWWLTRTRDNVEEVWSVDQTTGSVVDGPITIKLDEAAYTRAFSHDGTQHAIGTRSGRIYLWDLLHPTEPLVLQGMSDRIFTLSFDEKGRRLIAVDYDGAINVWPVDKNELRALACQYAGRNYTIAEWQQYFPNKPYRPTCTEWSSS